jgi:hypothetical protein
MHKENGRSFQSSGRWDLPGNLHTLDFLILCVLISFLLTRLFQLVINSCAI